MADTLLDPAALEVVDDGEARDEFDAALEVTSQAADAEWEQITRAALGEAVHDDGLSEAMLWLREAYGTDLPGGFKAWVLKQFDDKKHPRWPEGTPGGKGGQFMLVGERFMYGGKEYEIAAFQNGKVLSHLATGGKNDVQLLSLSPKQVAVGKIVLENVTPAKPFKMGSDKSFSADIPHTIVIDPYVQDDHDPSIAKPASFNCTDEQWARFGKIDQERINALEERFGPWSSGKSKTIINELKQAYHYNAQSAVESALSSQYGSSSGTTISLANVTGTSPESLAKYQEAKLLLEDAASAIQWDLYHRTQAPDVCMFHWGGTSPAQSKSTLIDQGVPLLSAYSMSTGFTQTSSFGPNVVGIPMAIRHVQMHTHSGGVHVDFSGEYEVTTGHRLKLDERTLLANLGGMDAGLKSYLGKYAPDAGEPASGEILLNAIKSLKDPNYDLPVPPQPPGIKPVHEAGKPSYEMPEVGWVNAKLGANAFTLGYAGGTKEGAEKPANQHGFIPGDFFEGLKGTRYFCIEDSGSPVGIRYVKIDPSSGELIPQKSYQLSGDQPFRKLAGHIDVPEKPDETGFVAMDDDQIAAHQPSAEPKKLSLFAKGERLIVDGKLYEITKPGGAQPEMQDLKSGKSFTINAGFKSSPVTQDGTYVAPPKSATPKPKHAAGGTGPTDVDIEGKTFKPGDELELGTYVKNAPVGTTVKHDYQGQTYPEMTKTADDEWKSEDGSLTLNWAGLYHQAGGFPKLVSGPQPDAEEVEPPYAPKPGEIVKISGPGVADFIGVYQETDANGKLHVGSLKNPGSLGPMYPASVVGPVDKYGVDTPTPGDKFPFNGKLYTVSSILKDGTVRAKPPGGKVEKFAPTDAALKGLFRPDAWIIDKGSKKKLKDFPVGATFSGTDSKAHPYLVAEKKPGGKVSVYNMETGEMAMLSGGKSYSPLTPAKSDHVEDDETKPVQSAGMGFKELVPAEKMTIMEYVAAGGGYCKNTSDGPMFMEVGDKDWKWYPVDEDGVQNGNGASFPKTLGASVQITPLVPKHTAASGDESTPFAEPGAVMTLKSIPVGAWFVTEDADDHTTVFKVLGHANGKTQYSMHESDGSKTSVPDGDTEDDTDLYKIIEPPAGVEAATSQEPSAHAKWEANVGKEVPLTADIPVGSVFKISPTGSQTWTIIDDGGVKKWQHTNGATKNIESLTGGGTYFILSVPSEPLQQEPTPEPVESVPSAPINPGPVEPSNFDMSQWKEGESVQLEDMPEGTVFLSATGLPLQLKSKKPVKGGSALALHNGKMIKNLPYSKEYTLLIQKSDDPKFDHAQLSKGDVVEVSKLQYGDTFNKFYDDVNGTNLNGHLKYVVTKAAEGDQDAKISLVAGSGNFFATSYQPGPEAKVSYIGKFAADDIQIAVPAPVTSEDMYGPGSPPLLDVTPFNGASYPPLSQVAPDTIVATKNQGLIKVVEHVPGSAFTKVVDLNGKVWKVGSDRKVFVENNAAQINAFNANLKMAQASAEPQPQTGTKVDETGTYGKSLGLTTGDVFFVDGQKVIVLPFDVAEKASGGATADQTKYVGAMNQNTSGVQFFDPKADNVTVAYGIKFGQEVDFTHEGTKGTGTAVAHTYMSDTSEPAVKVMSSNAMYTVPLDDVTPVAAAAPDTDFDPATAEQVKAFHEFNVGDVYTFQKQTGDYKDPMHFEVIEKNAHNVKIKALKTGEVHTHDFSAPLYHPALLIKKGTPPDAQPPEVPDGYSFVAGPMPLSQIPIGSIVASTSGTNPTTWELLGKQGGATHQGAIQNSSLGFTGTSANLGGDDAEYVVVKPGGPVQVLSAPKPTSDPLSIFGAVSKNKTPVADLRPNELVMLPNGKPGYHTQFGDLFELGSPTKSTTKAKSLKRLQLAVKLPDETHQLEVDTPDVVLSDLSVGQFAEHPKAGKLLIIGKSDEGLHALGLEPEGSEKNAKAGYIFWVPEWQAEGTTGDALKLVATAPDDPGTAGPVEPITPEPVLPDIVIGQKYVASQMPDGAIFLGGIDSKTPFVKSTGASGKPVFRLQKASDDHWTPIGDGMAYEVASVPMEPGAKQMVQNLSVGDTFAFERDGVPYEVVRVTSNGSLIVKPVGASHPLLPINANSSQFVYPSGS